MLFFKKIKWTDLLIKLSICLLVVILVSLITNDTFLSITPLQQLELKFIDLRFQRRGERNVKDSTKIVIVELNDETYKQIPYKWPWPRFIFAKLVDHLTEAGAKVIAIDVEFVKEDENPKNDALFREAIRKSGKVILAGKIDVEKERKLYQSMTGDFGEAKGKERSIVTENQAAEKYNFYNIFCDEDTLVSIVNIPKDMDDISRQYTPYVYTRLSNPPRTIPTFAMAVVNKYLGVPENSIPEMKDGFFTGSKFKIPAFNKTDFMVNFYGLGSTFLHYNFYEIIDDKDIKLKDEIDYGEDLNTWDDPDYRKIFKDKIVLIGSTSVEDKDFLSSPFSKGGRSGDNTIFGIEYHANAVQNILSNGYLYTLNVYWELLFFYVLAFIVFTFSSAVKKIKLKSKLIIEVLNAAAVLLLVFGLIELSIYIFAHYAYIISIVGSSAVVILTYFGNTAYHFYTERKQNVLIKGMFSHYVSGSVVDQLLADPSKLKLGGEKKNLTILFADIAGFTTFSETKTPEDLVKFINMFLNEMTGIILKNQGTLDKYLGDAIMAFWGAPLEIENHAELACKTASQMQEKIIELNQVMEHNFNLRFRMGVNSGDVVVGNIGGENRFDYTVIGDAVNLASRLEGVNKEFGTNIIIGEETSKLVEEKFFIRELDEVKVKGKKLPTRVFELIGPREDSVAELKYSLLVKYFEGLSYYRAKQFGEALKSFEDSIVLYPDDTPSAVYIERIKYFIQNPPDENWDGVFEMKTK